MITAQPAKSTNASSMRRSVSIVEVRLVGS